MEAKPTAPVTYAIFMRLIFPGAIASFLLHPYLALFVPPLRDLIAPGPLTAVYFAMTTIGFGMLFQFVHVPIYQFFEGYFLWKWIADKRVTKFDNSVANKWQRLQSLHRRLRDGNNAQISSEYDALFRDLARYPMMGGLRYKGVDKRMWRPYVPSATRLGTVILEYERYSETRYGMPATFYWYRVWQVVDRSLRLELTDASATADAAVYIAAASLCSAILYGLLWLCEIGVTYCGWRQGVPIIAAPLWFFGSALIYLIAYYSAVYLHAEYGRHFKSMFDVWRRRVVRGGQVDPDEKQSPLLQAATDEQREQAEAIYMDLDLSLHSQLETLKSRHREGREEH